MRVYEAGQYVTWTAPLLHNSIYVQYVTCLRPSAANNSPSDFHSPRDGA